jgi:hypothetical protein
MQRFNEAAEREFEPFRHLGYSPILLESTGRRALPVQFARGEKRIAPSKPMCGTMESKQEDLPRLDEKLKDLIKELGTAINDALSESRPITDAIQNVRDAGYDVFLVLEATIGFNRRPETSAADPSSPESGDTKLRVTSQDLKFLKSLKISVEDIHE